MDFLLPRVRQKFFVRRKIHYSNPNSGGDVPRLPNKDTPSLNIPSKDNPSKRSMDYSNKDTPSHSQNPPIQSPFQMNNKGYSKDNPSYLQDKG